MDHIIKLKEAAMKDELHGFYSRREQQTGYYADPEMLNWNKKIDQDTDRNKKHYIPDYFHNQIFSSV